MRIRVKKPEAGRVDEEESIRDVVTTVSYFYPQYTYQQILNMPIKTLKRHIRAVRREQSRYYLNMLKIANVVQSKSNAVSELAREYERDING
jgi:hypothetical protein